MPKDQDDVFAGRLAAVEKLLSRKLSAHERFLLEVLPNCDVRDFSNHIVVQSMLLRIAELLGVPLRELSESAQAVAIKAFREGKSYKAIAAAATKEHRREEEKKVTLR